MNLNGAVGWSASAASSRQRICGLLVAVADYPAPGLDARWLNGGLQW